MRLAYTASRGLAVNGRRPNRRERIGRERKAFSAERREADNPYSPLPMTALYLSVMDEPALRLSLALRRRSRRLID